MTQMTTKEYYQGFDDPRYLGVEKKERREKALEYALDTRKFEINLYWKRTAYFWAFIVSIYIAYYKVFTMDCSKLQDTSLIQPMVLLALSFLGCFFSLAWLMVNKGSKFWQKNWETHVYLLEDEVMGPLFKNHLNSKSGSLLCPIKEYDFSVSKVNMIASLIITLLSVFFFGWNIHQYFFDLICFVNCNEFFNVCSVLRSLIVTVVIMIVMGAVLFFSCRGNVKSKTSLPKLD